jgi:lipid-A-disaccharide synthase
MSFAPDERPVFIVAGEASGDIHAASLIRAVRAVAPERGLPVPRFYGMGGGRMADAGVAPLTRMEQVSVIGIAEVVRHLPRIWLTFRELVRSLDRERPRLAILVDFPDFNMRLAKQIKRRGIPLIWYISPQVWAWRSGRVATLKRLVDQMLTLFPFETDFYRTRGMDVTFVGHPLVDHVTPTRTAPDVRRELGVSDAAPLVALLPGSRRSELRTYLPAMLGAAERLAARRPDVRFALPLADSLDSSLIETALAECKATVIWRRGMFHDLLNAADAAVVASGTATLETALVGVPMLIVGRVSGLTAAYLRRFAHLPYVGLVNYVMGGVHVPELLQEAVTPENIAESLERLLTDETERARLCEVYAEIRTRLGAGGASERAGEAVVAFLHHLRNIPSA